MMDKRKLSAFMKAPRWRILQGLPPEELAEFLSRELDDGLPVDWGEWLREKAPLPHR